MKPLDTIPSLTDRVYSVILEEILEGKLVSGEHLVQEQLASELGVSRQPVQQAMALLKADGVVEETGRRGLTVARLDLASMRHHYDIRAVLDGYGARSAAVALRNDAAAVRKFEARAQSILRAGKTAVDMGLVRDQIHQDETLHKLIYAFSCNPVLAETAAPNWRFLRRAMADVMRHAEPPHAIWAQHDAIIQAISAGDAYRAERLAMEHVHVAADLLSKALRDRATGDIAPMKAVT